MQNSPRRGPPELTTTRTTTRTTRIHLKNFKNVLLDTPPPLQRLSVGVCLRQHILGQGAVKDHATATQRLGAALAPHEARNVAEGVGDEGRDLLPILLGVLGGREGGSEILFGQSCSEILGGNEIFCQSCSEVLGGNEIFCQSGSEVLGGNEIFCQSCEEFWEIFCQSCEEFWEGNYERL